MLKSKAAPYPTCWAHKRVFDQIGDSLRSILGEEANIFSSEDRRSIEDLPVLTHTIYDNTGTRIGEIQFGQGITYDVSRSYPQVEELLKTQYSNDQVSQLSKQYSQEWWGLYHERQRKLDELPSIWIKDIPELAHLDALNRYTDGHVLMTYQLIAPDRGTWLNKLLDVDDEQLNENRRILKEYLGEKILELDQKMSL